MVTYKDNPAPLFLQNTKILYNHLHQCHFANNISKMTGCLFKQKREVTGICLDKNVCVRDLLLCPTTEALFLVGWLYFLVFPSWLPCRPFKMMFKIIVINLKWVKMWLTLPQLLSIIYSSVPYYLSKSNQNRGRWGRRSKHQQSHSC